MGLGALSRRVTGDEQDRDAQQALAAETRRRKNVPKESREDSGLTGGFRVTDDAWKAAADGEGGSARTGDVPVSNREGEKNSDKPWNKTGMDSTDRAGDGELTRVVLIED